MRYRVALLLTIFLFLASYANLRSAPQDEMWYWAQREGANELLAFDTVGETHRLIEFEDEIHAIEGWRLDNQTALTWLFLGDDTQIYLYILTPDAAYPVTLNFDADQLHLPSLDDRYDFIVWSGHTARYVNESTILVQLTRNTYYRLPLRLLINLETHSAEPLFDVDTELWYEDFSDQPSYAADDHIRDYEFSEDGQLLRYVTQDTSLILQERSLVTKEERIIYTTDDFNYLVYQDHHGERWLFSRPDWSSGILVYSDGTSESVTIGLAEEVNLCLIYVSEYSYDIAVGSDCYLFYARDNDLHVTTGNCQQECILKIYPNTTFVDLLTLPSERLRFLDFRAPSQLALIYFDGSLVGDDRTLIYESSRYWLLHTDGKLVFVGEDVRMPSHTYDRKLSLDGHWLLVETERVNEMRHYGVWDLIEEQLVFEDELNGNFVFARQYSEGMIFDDTTNTGTMDTWFFRFIDRQAFEIPNGTYFDVLDGNSLFYELDDNWSGNQGGEDGIYRFDVEQDNNVQLLADVDRIVLQDVTPP